VTSTVVITAALALIVGAHYLTPISGTVLFWAAYVLTRPFGANAGNTLSKSPDEGGLGMGTYGASGVLAGLLVILVVHQIRTRRRQTRLIKELDLPTHEARGSRVGEPHGRPGHRGPA
jgi:uncharacterized membrane-anchored protein